jgi:hypothetical protein
MIKNGLHQIWYIGKIQKARTGERNVREIREFDIPG